MTAIANYGTEYKIRNWIKVYENVKEMVADIINCYNKNCNYEGIIRMKNMPRIEARTIGAYIEFRCIDKDPTYFWERNNKIKIPFTDNKEYLEGIIKKMRTWGHQ